MRGLVAGGSEKLRRGSSGVPAAATPAQQRAGGFQALKRLIWIHFGPFHRCLSRELVYAESRKAILSTQRGLRALESSLPVGAVEEVGGLNARVSLSLAMATFSQAMKKRKEALNRALLSGDGQVLHSPEAYNSWLQAHNTLFVSLSIGRGVDRTP